MSVAPTAEAPRGHAAISAVLFTSLFAAQAGLIAVSPVLAPLARDLDVSTAVAGQLRTITGIVAATAALAAGRRIAQRVGLGRQLLVASLLLALGSLASAAAPTFALLAVAQIPVGIAVGIYTTAGTLAAAEWVPTAQRTRVLSWALIGQPAAWLLGMPLVGLVGERSWRHGWLVLPLAAALVAAAAVVHRAGEPPRPTARARLRPALSHPGVSRWLGAETLANTAWAGLIVYSGALFVDVYAISTRTVGIVLAGGAGAYIVGNRLARGAASRGSRRVLIALVLALAAAAASFGVVHTSLGFSAALFSAAAFVAGARTLVSSAHGLSVPTELRPAVMGGRAASMQLGYFVGSGGGGIALYAGGYTTLGVALALLLVGAAVVLSWPQQPARRREAPAVPEHADLLAACTT